MVDQSLLEEAEEIRQEIDGFLGQAREELTNRFLSCERRAAALSTVREMLAMKESLHEVIETIETECRQMIDDREGEEWKP